MKKIYFLILIVFLGCSESIERDNLQKTVEIWNKETKKQLKENCIFSSHLNGNALIFHYLIEKEEIRKKLFEYLTDKKIIVLNENILVLEKYSEGYFCYKATVCNYQKSACYDFRYVHGKIEHIKDDPKKHFDYYKQDLESILKMNSFECDINTVNYFKSATLITNINNSKDRISLIKAIYR